LNAENHFDLAGRAAQGDVQEGFNPDFPPWDGHQQLDALKTRGVPADGRDLRPLLCLPIDNDSHAISIRSK